MARHTIALLPGDGVGPEVMAAARRVLDRLELDAEYRTGDIGWKFWCTEGTALPQRTLAMLEECACALFGAITSKPADAAARELSPPLAGRGLTYVSPIVRLRQELDLHTNLRPCRAIPGNPLNLRNDVDLVVFRENTEGSYAGIEFGPVPEAVRRCLFESHPEARRFRGVSPADLAISLRVMTRSRCRNIVARAFEYARDRGRRSVTVVEKANVLRKTGGLMLEEARRVAAKFPQITLQETNIDYQCMALLSTPERFDVLVAENLFGDILSDLAAQLVGGPGFAPSANLGDAFAVFEPVHGSAPDIAGQNRVNPVAMLASVVLMLEWLGEEERAARLDRAVRDVIRAGSPRTPDLGGTATTEAMAAAVAERC
jgi:isocitrate/isopropylmalate dehydrogenase